MFKEGLKSKGKPKCKNKQVTFKKTSVDTVKMSKKSFQNLVAVESQNSDRSGTTLMDLDLPIMGGIFQLPNHGEKWDDMHGFPGMPISISSPTFTINILRQM